MPIPHQRNFKKFIEFDSYGNISNTLRFFAKLITHKCADVERMFVISYFLSDDTISVFEPIERNSGYTGGMFLKRVRVKKPGQEVFKSEFSEYIKAEELYVGAKMNVNGYLFFLVNADEYTLNYMERNSDKVNSLGIILDFAPQHSAVCVFLTPGLFFFALQPILHCAFTHVGMNNGSA